MKNTARVHHGPAFRMTRQRRIILEHVTSGGDHPTADEVYHAVRRKLPHVSMGTIYRNLEVLSELGLIQKLEFGDGPRRFDGGPPGHYHVRCLVCGRVGDVCASLPEGFHRQCAHASDYRILSHRLELVGLCPACEARKSRPGRKRRQPSGLVTMRRQ